MSETPTWVTTAEIADLLAWARRLTEAGRHADPAEHAAYQAANTDLLARITATTTSSSEGGGS